jgi:hypothetical protein
MTRLTSHLTRFKTLSDYCRNITYKNYDDHSTQKDIKSVSTTIGQQPAASGSALRRATLTAAQAFLALLWRLTNCDTVTKHIRTCTFAEVHYKRQEMAFDCHSHNIYPKISAPIII